MFSREVDTVCELAPSATCLPDRGSDHPAFRQMGFAWGSTMEQDPRYRCVTLPSGFHIVEVDVCRYEIRDHLGNIRAVVMTPLQRPRIPTIAPVKRFSVSVEAVGDKHRGVVLDRGAALYRTPLFSVQKDAVAKAKNWLDEHRPLWESYTSGINFEPRS
jgi:hypothetical protein